jgi:hypothetical protein
VALNVISGFVTLTCFVLATIVGFCVGIELAGIMSQ